MGRNKKQISEKSPFKLRQRLLKDGRRSLFIDHFSNGQHQYEFLKLYLLPESCESIRRENRRTLRKAREEVHKRTYRILSKTSPLIDMKKKREIFLSRFIDILIEEYRKTGRKGYRHLITAKTNLHKFKPHIRVCDIDAKFCREYSFWLQYKCESQRGGPLAPMTAHVYCRKLRLILEHAVRYRLLDTNPWNFLDRRTRIPEPEREQRFLTQAEVAKLEVTPYKYPMIKSAFLFACFSGLRISDILKLQWHEIGYSQNRFFLNIIMKKTLKPLSVPLSMKAVNYLPYRIGDNNLVFAGLPRESQIQKHLKRFCNIAGIRGRAHFHMSRHTFATMLLTSGVDIYTASNLMGHTDIRSTQVYAKIIDNKKIAAINLLDKLN